jgi:hypothetical protein
MILYQNKEHKEKLVHNVLGFDYVLETKSQYIEINVIDGKVAEIYVDDKTDSNVSEFEDILVESYEIIAFAKDIQILKGQSITLIKTNVNAYESNYKTLK